MLTIHKSKRAVSVSTWRRDAVEVRWKMLECCQVRVSFWPHLSLFSGSKCVCLCERESERETELNTLVPANIYTKRANLEQHSWSNLSAEPKSDTRSNNLWTIFQNLFSVKYLFFSVECRKCRGPWSLMSIYSTMTSKKASKYFCKFSEKDMAKSVSDAGHYFARCIIILKEQCCMSM